MIVWHFCGVFQSSESTSVRVRLLWDTLTPDTDYWPPLYVLWRIHSKKSRIHADAMHTEHQQFNFPTDLCVSKQRLTVM